MKRRLAIAGTQHLVAWSRDTHKVKGASGDYTEASETSTKALNKDLREPSELVFFPGGVYECTTNDPGGRFSQSQTAYLLDLPTDDHVANYRALKVWIAPVGGNNTMFPRDTLSSRDALVRLGWAEDTLDVPQSETSMFAVG